MSSGETLNRMQRTEAFFPIAVMAVLLVLILPLPTFLLDIFLALSIASVVLLLMVTLNVRQPLELSVFPSLLLLLTLFRLSLNVATTRLILLEGDAGKIVETFGRFVVGGNLVVGLVVFLILVVIQFVVITKGATRISEVGARFTLDAMPGKQMAIDADLNAGIINDAQAKFRRERLMQEAEFYGAMDGAGKFVRGDAIAGLIITAINLVGGIIIGLINGQTIQEAGRKYSILTIGDGLVSQIPALIIATASAMLITKSTSESSVGLEIGLQFLGRRRPLMLGAGVLASMALVPGLPSIPFLGLAGLMWFIARQLPERLPVAEAAAEEKRRAEEPPPKTPIEQHLDEFLEKDRACVEIGTRLIPMMDPRRGLSLLQRIGTLRRDLARRYGIWVPLVRVRDNAQLEPENYTFLIGGQEVARGRIEADALLAIHPDGTRIPVDGIDTRDPAFGLAAKWIAESDRAQAEIFGCTVVDSPSVLITHLREVLRRHAGELLSRQDLNKLIDKVKETDTAVVDELIPTTISMGTLHRILRSLLAEQVPITNLTRILEAIASHAASQKDPDELVERIRADLSRSICDPYVDENGQIHAIVFDPKLELDLRRSTHDRKIALEPDRLEKLIIKLATECRDASTRKREVALLVDASLRRAIRQLLSRALPDLAVISYAEVPNDVLLQPDVIIKMEDIGAPRQMPGRDAAA